MFQLSCDGRMETLVKKKKNGKANRAIVCIVLLATLYLITSSAQFCVSRLVRLFSGCLICTVAVPILLWIFIWLYGQFEQKHTIASFDIGQTDADRTQNEDEANAAELKRKSAVAPATISRAAALFSFRTLFYVSTASFSFSALSS